MLFTTGIIPEQDGVCAVSLCVWNEVVFFHHKNKIGEVY